MLLPHFKRSYMERNVSRSSTGFVWFTKSGIETIDGRHEKRKVVFYYARGSSNEGVNRVSMGSVLHGNKAF